MARRPQFRDEDILEAARAVFLARGVRATTAEVAERAGVSEGTIFHHFKSKEALFRAALNTTLEESSEITGLMDRVGQGSVAENLRAFVAAVIDSLRVRVPFIMLAWSNPGRDGVSAICDLEPPGLRIVRMLAGYVDGEVRLGRIRRVDPEIVARGLVGSIFDYVMTEILHGAPHGLPLPAAMYVRGLVDVFLHGIAPTPVAPPPMKRRRTRA
jgi:AcrR family transcriptional regulator